MIAMRIRYFVRRRDPLLSSQLWNEQAIHGGFLSFWMEGKHNQREKHAEVSARRSVYSGYHIIDPYYQ